MSEGAVLCDSSDSAISLTEMVAFCQEHSPLNPNEDGSDQIEFDVDVDDDDNEDGVEQPEGPWIRLIMTTKRLLANSKLYVMV